MVPRAERKRDALVGKSEGQVEESEDWRAWTLGSEVGRGRRV